MASETDPIVLLNGLSASDSEQRKKAEEVYNTIPAKDRFSFLGACLCRKDLPHTIRIFAAILLRRLLISSWNEITPAIEQQQLLASCNELLKVLKDSAMESREIREKMAHVIGILARNFVDEQSQTQKWTEFLQVFAELIESPATEQQEAMLVIVSTNPEIFSVGPSRVQNVSDIVTRVSQGLNRPNLPESYYELGIAAIAALVSVIGDKDVDNVILSTGNVAFNVLMRIKDESIKESICQHMIDLAENAPAVFRSSVKNIVLLCLNYMSECDGSESSLNFTALELVVSIIENRPGLYKKRCLDTLRTLLDRMLGFMASIDDDVDWYTTCTNDKDEEDPDAIGESALDRVSNALGGKTLLPLLIEQTKALLSKPDWQSRHAALMALSCAGEGCRPQLTKILDKVVHGIINYLNDPHPRVRYAACNAIGQMATDFSTEFETKFHGQVIPALCRLIIDPTHIRVQAHAACAMVNFFEECPQDILANYLDVITEHIQIALSGYMGEGIPKDECKLFVIENTIVALSSVADSSAELFVKYYDKFMPCLKFIIKNTTDVESLREMRGKAIECVSLIGMAVGKEKFCADSTDIMQMLLATQTGQLKLADDDPQLSYMMAAWARICRILGADFQPYLPYVMEPVLKAASLKVEIALLNEEDRAAIEGSSDWESVSVQDHSVGIRTAGLEDKATACSMLVCYARELKHGFADYVERTAEVLIPLLKFPFHDDVRCAAAEAMPFLLESCKPRGEQCVSLLWNAIFDNLVSAQEADIDVSIINQLMESLASCIEVIGAGGMTPDRFEQVTLKLLDRFNAHFTNLAEEYERRKDEDYETDSECSDGDNDCLVGIAAVIHSLFVVYKSDYLPYFHRLVEHILKLFVEGYATPWSNKQTALCIWDDVIEYTGQTSVNEYSKFYLPLMTNGIVNSNKEIRQAALYGTGQLAQHIGAPLMEFYQGVIPHIVQMINHQEARSDEHIMATENGISTIGRILRYCPQVPNYDDLLKCWIGWLPIWEDEAEVPVVMEFLLQLIEQNNQTVMGPNSSNLPRLVAIVAEVFARSAIETTTDVGLKLVSFLKQVHANPVMSACLGSLTLEQQKAVQEVIAN